MGDIDQAQATVDQEWGTYEGVRGPLRDELLNVFRDLEGVTGMQAGPGAQRLADVVLDFAQSHVDEVGTANEARKAALSAEQQRDTLIAAQPIPDVAPPPPMFTTQDLNETRRWLQGANDKDVGNALNEILDAGERREWAVRLLAWGRADGNVAQVFAKINEAITPDNPASIPTSVNEQQPPSASADDEPKTSETVPRGGAEEIAAWAKDNVSRARQAYDAELSSPSPRLEVLNVLVDILDVPTATTTPAPQRPTPEPPVADAPADVPAPDATPVVDDTPTP